MKTPAAIIDLDNCISNDQWRLCFIKPSYYHPEERFWEYHNRCHLDLFDNRDIIERLSADYRLFIFTSRPETVRQQTERWLERHQIPYERILMRPFKNYQTSTSLKRQMLTKLPAACQVEYAIDDRHDILKIYADHGIKQTQRVFIYEPRMVHP